MSVETIAVVVSAAGLALTFIVTFATGFGWVIHRLDLFRREFRDETAGLRQEVRDETTGLRQELRDQITGVRQELGDRISGVERELVEVKIAVARIEGPPRHLMHAR